MELWGHIGSARATSELHHLSTIYRTLEMRWSTWQMMPFRNIVRDMDGINREIKCHTMSSRDTWTPFMAKANLTSARWYTPKWKISHLTQLKPLIFSWIPTKDSTISKYLVWTSWLTPITTSGSSRSTLIPASSWAANSSAESSPPCWSSPSG